MKWTKIVASNASAASRSRRGLARPTAFLLVLTLTATLVALGANVYFALRNPNRHKDSRSRESSILKPSSSPTAPPSPASTKKQYRLLKTAYKSLSAAASIPWEILGTTPPDPPPDVVGVDTKKYCGTFDGTRMTLRPQVPLRNKLYSVVLTAAERNGSTLPLPYTKWVGSIWGVLTALKNLNWTLYTNQTGEPSLFILQSRDAGSRNGRYLASKIGENSCLAGNKIQQLECRRDLAEMHGCDFDDLKISPPQYALQSLNDCRRFFAKANTSEQRSKMYLVKDATASHGDGITIHHGTDTLLQAYGRCEKPRQSLIMDYVDNPALIDGRKVDIRTFLLVASLNPKLVFYHDGYGRVSSVNYSRAATQNVVHISNSRHQALFYERFLNFSRLTTKLEAQHPDVFNATVLQQTMRRRAKAVSRFVFEAGLSELRHRRGRFQIFAVDWSLDDRGRLGLLEVNGAPLLIVMPWIQITSRMYETMLELVTLVQTNPAELRANVLVREGFNYKGWELVYNEMEAWYDRVHGKSYNACRVFLEEQVLP